MQALQLTWCLIYAAFIVLLQFEDYFTPYDRFFFSYRFLLDLDLDQICEFTWFKCTQEVRECIWMFVPSSDFRLNVFVSQSPFFRDRERPGSPSRRRLPAASGCSC